MPDRFPSRLRVLLIAEACNPTWTSVPLVGYNFACALAERPDLDITLVSQVRNRSALEADPIASLVQLRFIDNEWLAAPLYGLARFLRGGTALSWTIDTAMAWPSYMVFENEVACRFGRQLDAGRFDLIHRVTPLTPTMGSPLARRTGVPMLIGPLNGGLPWPKEYPELRRQEKEWLVPLRGLYRHLPYYRATYRHLAGVIAGSRHTATEIPRSFRGRRFYLPENGVDPARFPLASAWPEPKNRFRFVTVGRLVPYKGVDLTLEAMSRSAALKACELCVIGDGPQRTQLEALTRQYGLEGNVQFLGWVDQKRLGEEFRRSQVFVFPSLREFGGGVALEALASALPAIIVAYGGPAELVTPECGVLVPLRPRAELVPALQAAMEQLAADPVRCRALGQAACNRVRDEFTWTAKAGRLAAIYRQLLDGDGTAAG
ncbi:MAG: glycosyltransferase family 4 protein [Gemmataceae bacterium]|nr:glycosyltransferase family 4 protein [Gemmataceae bacterium]